MISSNQTLCCVCFEPACRLLLKLYKLTQTAATADAAALRLHSITQRPPR